MFKHLGESKFGRSSLNSNHGSGERGGVRKQKQKKRTTDAVVQGDYLTAFPADSSEYELVPVSNGRHIFKNVDFEIMSETASQGRGGKVWKESWEHIDKR